MSDSPRSRRLAGRIRQIVASYIETQIKDPRLGMVTITDVRMTGDLHDVTIFFTVFGDDIARSDSTAAIEAAKGQIRSEVGRQTGVKFTPALTFVLDQLPDSAKHLDELLEAARVADVAVHKAREGAQYAGDSDPYKHDEPEQVQDSVEQAQDSVKEATS